MSWHRISNFPRVPSPALLIYEDRWHENLRRMVNIAGSPARLRPHLKTHKLPQVLHKQLDLGITKVKCATIAEAEMAALSGVPDVLLAGQPVGANAWRFLELQQRFGSVAFSALVDNASTLADLQEAAEEEGQTVKLLLDLNVGQNRTGVLPDERAVDLYRQLENAPNLAPGGLHVYDGHLHQTDLAERTTAAHAVYKLAADLRSELVRQGLPVEKMIIGGSPTFAIHAAWQDVELSPGTTVLWDAGYGQKLPDLDFLPAAVLLCRVISKPTSETLCLDLGHKAVASEMPHPRVIFPDLSDAEAVMHNEEHLVIRTREAAEFSPGDAIYAIPWHICPTVALHSEVWCVRDGAAAEPWPVVGRARRLSI